MLWFGDSTPSKRILARSDVCRNTQTIIVAASPQVLTSEGEGLVCTSPSIIIVFIPRWTQVFKQSFLYTMSLYLLNVCAVKICHETVASCVDRGTRTRTYVTVALKTE